jgi:SHS2 domain-containing protein
MPNFEVIDHTADVGIVAYGNSVEEVFLNAADGVFSLIADLGKVDEETSQQIVVDAPDQEELLVAWINELLYLFDAENLIFSRFKIVELGKTKLKAIAYGEQVDPDRHDLRAQVKAATYHRLKLKKGKDGFRAQLILDI